MKRDPGHEFGSDTSRKFPALFPVKREFRQPESAGSNADDEREHARLGLRACFRERHAMIRGRAGPAIWCERVPG